MLNILRKLFDKPKTEIHADTKGSKGITKEMIYSLRDGIKLSDEGKHEEAVSKFDMAIESGIFEEAYRERGYSLQILGFHLDAIDDFSTAIDLFPENANNYYGRALSYGRLGYYEQATVDAEKAVELSQIKSQENFQLNQIANKKNIMPPTLLYKEYLDELWRRRNQTNEFLRQAYISPAIRRNKNI
jgi:tetratricopeptide (TPR) repeat protein